MKFPLKCLRYSMFILCHPLLLPPDSKALLLHTPHPQAQELHICVMEFLEEKTPLCFSVVYTQTTVHAEYKTTHLQLKPFVLPGKAPTWIMPMMFDFKRPKSLRNFMTVSAAGSRSRDCSKVKQQR